MNFHQLHYSFPFSLIPFSLVMARGKSPRDGHHITVTKCILNFFLTELDYQVTSPLLGNLITHLQINNNRNKLV